MNFSSRSTVALHASTRRIPGSSEARCPEALGSNRSPSAVDPHTSQKSTVASFRRSRTTFPRAALHIRAEAGVGGALLSTLGTQTHPLRLRPRLVNFHGVAPDAAARVAFTAVKVMLRPMRSDEFPAFEAESKSGYARDLSENGGVDAGAARTKAECDFARLLPDGVASAGQFLFVIEDELGAAKGTLWFADEERNGRRCAFL